MIATIFCLLLGLYLVCGLAFAVPFALWGVQKVDGHAVGAGWGFRLIIIPGTMLLWPLLLGRWWRGRAHPPTERTAHRAATEDGHA